MTNRSTMSLMPSHIDAIIVSAPATYHTRNFIPLPYVHCTSRPVTRGRSFAEAKGWRSSLLSSPLHSIAPIPFLSIRTIYRWKSCNAEKCLERNFQRDSGGAILKCNDREYLAMIILSPFFRFLFLSHLSIYLSIYLSLPLLFVVCSVSFAFRPFRHLFSKIKGHTPRKLGRNCAKPSI